MKHPLPLQPLPTPCTPPWKPRVKVFAAHLTSGTYWLAIVRTPHYTFSTDYLPNTGAMWQAVESGLMALR